MGARCHNNHNHNDDGSAGNHDDGGSNNDNGSAGNHDDGGLATNNGRFCGGADGASFGTSGPGNWFSHLHRVTTGSVRESCCGTGRNRADFY